MTTSCLICSPDKNKKKIFCVRCQKDGYPEYILPILNKRRNTLTDAIDLCRDYGNFFFLEKNGQPDKHDRGFNKGLPYFIKYCSKEQLADRIYLNKDLNFILDEIEYIYYFDDKKEKWICLEPHEMSLSYESFCRNNRQRKFEMGLRADGSISRFKNVKQEKENLVKDLRELQSQIDLDIAIKDDYSITLSMIASDFHGCLIQATDVKELKNNEEIRLFIDNIFGEVIDNSYVKDKKIYFDVYVETKKGLSLKSKLNLENAVGVSNNETVDVYAEIENDTTVKVIAIINR